MNNKSENLVIWEKWRDPFLGYDENEIDVDKVNFTDEETNDDLEDAIDNQNIKQSDAVKVIATPMGIIPITENTASSKIFNFWIGHTNFNITKKLAEIIEDTEGVEALDIFTRYRFRIAIGKTFIDSHVMRNINDNVYTYLG